MELILRKKVSLTGPNLESARVKSDRSRRYGRSSIAGVGKTTSGLVKPGGESGAGWRLCPVATLITIEANV